MNIIFPFIINAQVVSDAKLWAGLSITKKVNDFEFSFSEEVRMDENVRIRGVQIVHIYD